MRDIELLLILMYILDMQVFTFLKGSKKSSIVRKT